MLVNVKELELTVDDEGETPKSLSNSMSKRLSNKFVNDSRIDVSSAKDSRLYSGRDSMRPTPREQDQNNIVEMQR